MSTTCGTESLRQHHRLQGSRHPATARKTMCHDSKSGTSSSLPGLAKPTPYLLKGFAKIHRASRQRALSHSACSLSPPQHLQLPRAIPSALVFNTVTAGDRRSCLLAPHVDLAPRQPADTLAPSSYYKIIALKELKAVQHGLQENLPFIQGQRIRLFQDNTNVVVCLTKFSSRSKPLMDELYHLVPWLQQHKISLEVLYIRSEHNIANPASRRRNADLWSLKPRTQNFLLQQVYQLLGQPVDTDPFARHQSAVATRYCTPLHDRHSAGFKMKASRAQGVVVYPQ